MLCGPVCRTLSWNCLNRFMHEASRLMDPSWITLFPLYHILQGSSVPYASPKIDVNHANDKWWAICDATSAIKTFKDEIWHHEQYVILLNLRNYICH